MEIHVCRDRKWLLLTLKQSNRSCPRQEVRKLSSKQPNKHKRLQQITSRKQDSSQRLSRLGWKISPLKRRKWNGRYRGRPRYNRYTSMSRSTSSRSSSNSPNSFRSQRMRKRSRSYSLFSKSQTSRFRFQWSRNLKCSKWWTLLTASLWWEWSKTLSCKSTRSSVGTRLCRALVHRPSTGSISESTLMQLSRAPRNSWISMEVVGG